MAERSVNLLTIGTIAIASLVLFSFLTAYFILPTYDAASVGGAACNPGTFKPFDVSQCVQRGNQLVCDVAEPMQSCLTDDFGADHFYQCYAGSCTTKLVDFAFEDTDFAQDSSGRGIDAVCTNCPSRAMGVRGNALSLDGVKDPLQLDFWEDDFPRQFTVMAWLKPSTSYVSSATLLTNRDENGYGMTILLGPSSSPAPGFIPGSVSVVVREQTDVGSGVKSLLARANGVLEFNKWNHVAIAVDLDAGTATVFKNANVQQVVATQQDGVSAPSTDLHIETGEYFLLGDSIDGAGNPSPFVGQIDDFRIVPRLMDSSDMQNVIADDTSTLALYSFDQFAAQTNGDILFADSSINTLHATCTPSFGAGWNGCPTEVDGIDAFSGKAASFFRSQLRVPLTNFGDVFTLSFRLRPSQSDGVIFSTGSGQDGNDFYLSVLADGSIHLFTGLGGSGNYERAYSTASLVQDGATWNHVAVVVDKLNGKARFYINGNDRTSQNRIPGTTDIVFDDRVSTSFATNADWFIGALETQDQAFNGALDDFSVHAKALSATDIICLIHTGNIDCGGSDPNGNGYPDASDLAVARVISSADLTDVLLNMHSYYDIYGDGFISVGAPEDTMPNGRFTSQDVFSLRHGICPVQDCDFNQNGDVNDDYDYINSVHIALYDLNQNGIFDDESFANDIIAGIQQCTFGNAAACDVTGDGVFNENDVEALRSGSFYVGEPACGDGFQTAPEECDDGNTIPGDRCDATCHNEPYCGDGVVNQPSEQCDDRNLVDSDGCSNSCLLSVPPAATCSDAIQNQGETGVDCGGPCSACVPPSSCSDSIKNGNEVGIDCGGSCAACTFDFEPYAVGSFPSDWTRSGDAIVASGTSNQGETSAAGMSGSNYLLIGRNVQTATVNTPTFILPPQVSQIKFKAAGAGGSSTWSFEVVSPFQGTLCATSFKTTGATSNTFVEASCSSPMLMSQEFRGVFIRIRDTGTTISQTLYIDHIRIVQSGIEIMPK